MPDSPRTVGVALRAIALWTAARRRGDDAACLEVRVGGDRKENRCIVIHLQHSAFAHITLRISSFPETKTKFRGKTKRRTSPRVGVAFIAFKSNLHVAIEVLGSSAILYVTLASTFKLRFTGYQP